MKTHKNNKGPMIHLRKTHSKLQRGGAQEDQRNAADDILITLSDLNDPDVIKAIANLLEKEEVSSFAKNMALRKASKAGHIEIVELLLNKGADVNDPNDDGRTALIWASLREHPEIEAMLLKQPGIDVDMKRNNGDTDLMVASRNGHTKVVKMLLENRADVNAKNNDGETALNMASNYGHTEIEELLKNHTKQIRLGVSNVLAEKHIPTGVRQTIANFVAGQKGGKRKTHKKHHRNNKRSKKNGRKPHSKKK